MNANTSRTFAAAGSCTAAAGECTYTPTDTTCANGCDSGTGRCTGDPCGSVTCNQPPGACSLDVGDCNNGTCTYGPKPTGVRCDDGDQCTSDETCNGNGQCAATTRDSGCGGSDGGTDGGTDGGVPPDGSAGRPDSGVRPDGGAGKGGAGVVSGEDDGCGCRLPGSSGGHGSIAALAALAWLVARRRRRA